ncbi:MAG: flagellar type III secretion system protein FliQ [Planctomycetes bacterium]|nr:flagellar type III secretion system protein FliQ [Planctomycetota bacterium]
MDSTFVIFLGRQTLETALLVAAPVLLTCVIVGVVVTLLQAVTSIRDMSLTVVPKLMAVGFVTLLFGNWMLGALLKFTNGIFSYIQSVGQ